MKLMFRIHRAPFSQIGYSAESPFSMMGDPAVSGNLATRRPETIVAEKTGSRQSCYVRLGCR